MVKKNRRRKFSFIQSKYKSSFFYFFTFMKSESRIETGCRLRNYRKKCGGLELPISEEIQRIPGLFCLLSKKKVLKQADYLHDCYYECYVQSTN